MVYLSLFAISFLGGSILPISSELTLGGLLITNNYDALALLFIASFGNILGAVCNWILGFYLLKHISKKWFPFTLQQINKASIWFKKFGVWSLLFSWLPIIGDPLTLVAGILKLRFYIFLFLVSVGKISRYIFLYYLIN
jgi:membrane protein YqaA with SNARE-associated domain|tara:strand:+ start:1557 stop:1973 length:417 start_codon:yes stop_codon:yes gene_type:complete